MLFNIGFCVLLLKLVVQAEVGQDIFQNCGCNHTQHSHRKLWRQPNAALSPQKIGKKAQREQKTWNQQYISLSINLNYFNNMKKNIVQKLYSSMPCSEEYQ